MSAPKRHSALAVCGFGLHRGTPYTRLPVGYLKWMVRERHSEAAFAAAELDRRSTVTPDLDVSGHAIDRASLHKAVRATWIEDERDREPRRGIHGWLCTIARSALEHGTRDAQGRCHYRGLVFVFEEEGVWPLLKTVMPGSTSSEQMRQASTAGGKRGTMEKTTSNTPAVALAGRALASAHEEQTSEVRCYIDDAGQSGQMVAVTRQSPGGVVLWSGTDVEILAAADSLWEAACGEPLPRTGAKQLLVAVHALEPIRRTDGNTTLTVRGAEHGAVRSLQITAHRGHQRRAQAGATLSAVLLKTKPSIEIVKIEDPPQYVIKDEGECMTKIQ